MKGLLAPLSSNEEITLRRLAIGSTSQHKLPAEHLKRLERLKLIEVSRSGYRLTPLGRQRYDALPRPAGLAIDGSPRAIEQMLSNLIRARQT
jgi:hypothetical protein